MTEYSDLATQTSGGTPGSAWANQLINNQKALIHPPSARFINAAEIGSTGSTPSTLVAGTYAKVAFVGLSTTDDVYADTSVQKTQVWATDVGGGTVDSFEDSAHDTFAGFDVIDSATNVFSPVDSFKVPRAGLYLVSAWVGVAATSGVLTVALAVNAARGYAFSQQGGTTTTGQNAAVSTILDLSTSSYLDVQVRHSTATTVNAGALSIVRLSERPNS
jgi:hypothetical protein